MSKTLVFLLTAYLSLYLMHTTKALKSSRGEGYPLFWRCKRHVINHLYYLSIQEYIYGHHRYPDNYFQNL